MTCPPVAPPLVGGVVERLLGRDSYLVPTLSRIPILHSMGSSGPQEGISANVGARRDSRTSRRYRFLPPKGEDAAGGCPLGAVTRGDGDLYPLGPGECGWIQVDRELVVFDSDVGRSCDAMKTDA